LDVWQDTTPDDDKLFIDSLGIDITVIEEGIEVSTDDGILPWFLGFAMCVNPLALEV
jgi:hypothetical protein